MRQRPLSIHLQLIAAILLVTLFSAPAALLVHLDFQDGASVGVPVVSTANQGTAGGTGTGSDLDGAGPGGVTYTAGPLSVTGGSQAARDRDRAALFVDPNTGSGVNPSGGRILFTLAAGQIAADSDWTFAAAVRIDGGNITFDRIVDPFLSIGNDDGSGEQPYSVIISLGGQAFYYDANPGQAIPLNDGQWHHLAVTSDYDGSANAARHYARVYVDGVQVGTAPFALRADFSGGITFSLGSQPSGSRPFDGAVDDVRFYSELLTPAQVYQLYYETMLIPEPASAALLGLSALALQSRRRRPRPCQSV